MYYVLNFFSCFVLSKEGKTATFKTLIFTSSNTAAVAPFQNYLLVLFYSYVVVFGVCVSIDIFLHWLRCMYALNSEARMESLKEKFNY